MARDDARPETGPRTVRDVGLLLFVATALIAGLVHYGVLVDQDHDPAGAAPTPPASSSLTTTPRSRPSATGSAPSAPMSASGTPPSTPPAPTSSTERASTTTAGSAGTCWNGRRVARLSACRLPTGVAGLAWVFPSFEAARASCHVAPGPVGDYDTVVARECFASVHGTAVAITYEQVRSRVAARHAIDLSYAAGHRYTFPGADGGRCTWFDPSSRPARVTAYYGGYPYVVSLYAPDQVVAKQAWATLVDLRPPGSIRGRPDA